MTTLYHGTNKIIERPTTDMIKYACGLGQGFYLTGDENRAKEYAVSLKEDGFVSKFSIDLERYNILDLRDEKYTPLNWVGIFAANRSIDVDSREALDAKNYLIDNYKVEGDFDIVIGPRCDGIFTRVATDFINGKLTYRNLCRMLNVGDAEIQVAILKDEVLDELQFDGYFYVSSDDVYSTKEMNNIKKLEGYKKRLETTVKNGDMFVFDIMNEGMR